MLARYRHNPYLTAVLVGGILSAAAVVSRPTPAPLTAYETIQDASEPCAVDLFTRSMAKDPIIDAVAAGRMSLPAAAAVFGWLNRLPPTAAWIGLPNISYVPGYQELRALARSESDLLCLNVVVHAKAKRAASPERLAEIEDEYRRACAAPGGAVLPEVIEADCRELLARAGVVRDQRMAGPGDFHVSLDGLQLVAEP
jgi:hypothetical protein